MVDFILIFLIAALGLLIRNYNTIKERVRIAKILEKLPGPPKVLRLYSSVDFISRKLGEDMISHHGYQIPKGSLVHIHIYDLHHNPNVYPDPENFDPDRFLPENLRNQHPYAYIPFSAGPRNCIGQKFAMLEVKAVLCGILSHFVLEPVDTPESIVPVVDMVLRTKEPIKVKFVNRQMM